MGIYNITTRSKAAENKAEPITLNNCELKWMNLAGRPTTFVREGGKRQMSIVIPDELIAPLQERGVNVKLHIPKSGDESYSFHYITVKCSYNGFAAPNVRMKQGRTETELNENTIGSIDFAEIESAHVTFAVANNEYHSLYLRSMVVVLKPDPYAHVYANQDVLGEDLVEDIPFN